MHVKENSTKSIEIENFCIESINRFIHDINSSQIDEQIELSTDPNDSFKILDYAFKKGIRELDTASNYGNSEVVIGSYIKQNPQKSFRINTKISSNTFL